MAFSIFCQQEREVQKSDIQGLFIGRIIILFVLFKQKKLKKLQCNGEEILFSIQVDVSKSLVISLGLIFITTEMGALTGVAGQSKQSAVPFYVLTKHVY